MEDKDNSPLQPKEMHTLLLKLPSQHYQQVASGANDRRRRKPMQEQWSRTLEELVLVLKLPSAEKINLIMSFRTSDAEHIEKFHLLKSKTRV